MNEPTFENVGGGFTIRREVLPNFPDHMRHAAIYFKASPYEAHGYAYGATPEEAERVARSRWPEGTFTEAAK